MPDRQQKTSSHLLLLSRMLCGKSAKFDHPTELKPTLEARVGFDFWKSASEGKNSVVLAVVPLPSFGSEGISQLMSALTATRSVQKRL